MSCVNVAIIIIVRVTTQQRKAFQSNSAILSNNYVSLLSDRLNAHAYEAENGVEWAAAAAW